MALYSDLPIYKHGCDLLSLALDVQTQIPRIFKRSLGEKIHALCVDMLEAMAMANASRGAQHYGRYVDDLYLLHESTQWLNSALASINTFVPQRLGAQLNPRKTILQPLERGIDFVGHVIKPWHRTTRKRTVATAVRRLQEMPAEDVFSAGNSYLGLLRQASHSHHDQAAVMNVLRKRGHSFKSDLTKIYRKKS